MSDIGGIAGERLKSFIERIDLLEEEKRALAEDIKEVFAEAKGVGFDVKIMRQVLKIRKMDKDARDEQEALLQTYLHALGMLADTPLGDSALRSHMLTAGLGAAAGVEGTLRAIKEFGEAAIS